MKIAQVAPLMESVPPRLYGGTERVVSYLTEELVRQGHDVTLFASGDSLTAARLVACSERALRLDPRRPDPAPFYIVMLEKIRQQARAFDIIHFHIDFLHFPFCRERDWCAVTTLHGRLDIPEYTCVYREFGDVPLISISNHQRAPMPPVNWVGTVHHGLPRGLYPFSAVPRGGYVAFLGRISPEKRPDRAIEIARRAGLPLKIAAKVDRVDEAYFRDRIEPLLAGPGVEFIGEIGERDKAAFLGDALALLFPIDWPEPFGLVMIEAMACGTPVIAYPCGSVPEVVEPGVNGYIVSSIEEAVDALRKIERLDRAAVRASFERRFTAERMASDYVRIYRMLAEPAMIARLRRRLPSWRARLGRLAAAAAMQRSARGERHQNA